MLIEMIFAEEGALLRASLLTCIKVVNCQVGVVGLGMSAECAARYIVLDCTRSIRTADPLLKR